MALRGEEAAKYLKLGQVTSFEYTGGPERERLPNKSDGVSLGELGARRKPSFVCRAEVFDPPALCFAWTDGAPGRVALTQEPWVRLLGAGKKPVPSCWRPLGSEGPEVCDPRVPARRSGAVSGGRFEDLEACPLRGEGLEVRVPSRGSEKHRQRKSSTRSISSMEEAKSFLRGPRS